MKRKIASLQTAALAAFDRIERVVSEEWSTIGPLRYRIRYKEDGSPVTEADVWMENRISGILREFIPDLVLVGEESFQSLADETGTIALVDPIDGTENFCSGLKEWGISVGIWHGGAHVASMLSMPELGERLVTGQKVEKLGSRITGFSSSFSEEIASGIRLAGEYRVTGCAVYNIYNVIRGAFVRFVNPKGARAWDLLPGAMLALEHGCEVNLDEKKYHGEFLDPSRKYRIDILHR